MDNAEVEVQQLWRPLQDDSGSPTEVPEGGLGKAAAAVEEEGETEAGTEIGVQVETDTTET